MAALGYIHSTAHTHRCPELGKSNIQLWIDFDSCPRASNARVRRKLAETLKDELSEDTRGLLALGDAPPTSPFRLSVQAALKAETERKRNAALEGEAKRKLIEAAKQTKNSVRLPPVPPVKVVRARPWKQPYTTPTSRHKVDTRRYPLRERISAVDPSLPKLLSRR